MDNTDNELSVGFGVANVTKSTLLGRADNPQDAYFVDGKNRFVALFDSLDDERGSSQSSKIAEQITERMLSDYETPISSSNLTWMLGQIDEKLKEERAVGGTSAILARVVEGIDGYKLIFVAIGDSRIYICQKDKVFQVTIDDALKQKDLDAMQIEDSEKRKNLMEQKLRKYLNSKEKLEISYNNAGEIKLNKGDRVLICSDGVTGETTNERLSDENILAVFDRNLDDETTARVFVKVARKMDDRTAIVISVR